MLNDTQALALERISDAIERAEEEAREEGLEIKTVNIGYELYNEAGGMLDVNGKPIASTVYGYPLQIDLVRDYMGATLNRDK